MRLVELQQGEDLEVLLRRLHLVEELPFHEVGRRLGIATLTAGTWIRRLGLDRRTQARERAMEVERAASGHVEHDTQEALAAPARSPVEGARQSNSAAAQGNPSPSTDDEAAA